MRKDICKCQKMAELIDKYDELSGKVEGTYSGACSVS